MATSWVLPAWQLPSARRSVDAASAHLSRNLEILRLVCDPFQQGGCSESFGDVWRVTGTVFSLTCWHAVIVTLQWPKSKAMGKPHITTWHGLSGLVWSHWVSMNLGCKVMVFIDATLAGLICLLSTFSMAVAGTGLLAHSSEKSTGRAWEAGRARDRLGEKLQPKDPHIGMMKTSKTASSFWFGRSLSGGEHTGVYSG